jgi:hypothetical protein
LQNRTLYVEIKADSDKELNKSHKSKKLTVQLGVPQGSIWGVDLFGITINDIFDANTDAEMTAYADDLSGLISGDTEKKVIENVQKTISEVTEVCDKKKLLIYPDKTMYIQVHTQKKIPDKSYLFKVNDKAVQRVEYAKLLGHFIDDQLNWNVHVYFLCSKLNTKIFMLFSARNKSSVESLLVLYNFFVYSDITNGIFFGVVI